MFNGWGSAMREVEPHQTVMVYPTAAQSIRAFAFFIIITKLVLDYFQK